MNLEESREGGPLKVRGDSGKLEKESPDFRSPEVGISVITQNAVHVWHHMWRV